MGLAACIVVAVCMGPGAASPVLAATATWIGGSGANWSTPSNWSPAATWTSTANAAMFNTAGAAVFVNSVTASSVTFSKSASISGGTISLMAGANDLVNNAAGVTTISSALNLIAPATSSFWAGNSAGTLNIAGPVSDSSGHLFFYDGNYSMGNAGSINLPSGSFALVLNDSANTTTNFTQTGGVISITRTTNGANLLYLSQGGSTNYTMSGGTTTLNGGSGGNGALLLNYTTGAGTLTINGALALLSTPQLILDYSGTSNGPSALNLQNGILESDSIYTQGSAASSVFNFSGGTLGPVDGSVSGWGSGAAANNISIALSGSNAMMTSNDAGGAGRIVNVYANVTGNGALNVAGSGALVLAGASNTYSGGTNVIGRGTLQLGGPTALGTGGLAVTSGTVDLAGNSPTIASLAGGNAGVIENVSSAANSVLTVAQSTSTRFSGSISNGPSGSVALVLASSNGAGTLTLAGANNYSGGTTVSGGSLVLASRGALVAGSSLTVGSVAAIQPPADFSGTTIVFNSNGGWCWFQDPRAIITNGQLIIGSIAGTTANGSTAGDADVTSYNFQTKTSTETLLHAAFDQDDHASPAFSVLPDGRIMVVYSTHGGTNYTEWRVSTSPGETTSWSAEQTSQVNSANDGNGNTYANPFYLSTPNEVVNFSRAIGYDPNYSTISNLSNTIPSFNYGGHWMYWSNPNNTPPLTGGNGRPYVKYASNGSDTVWFATTEDSPQNHANSLYVGYIKFTSSGSGNVYTSTGTDLGGLSTGTAPTGGSNPPAGGNQGDIASGTGLSYLPTDFTPIVKANTTYNGVNLTGKYVAWATSMQLDSSGDPYLGFVVVDNLTGAYGNNLEYYYAHFNGTTWQVSRVGYAGLPLYNGQNQYAGLLAVDPLDPDKIFISADVNPTTGAALLGPDGQQHWQILEGTSPNGGTSWDWSQITDTSSDNVRPEVVANDGMEALVWERGSYTSFTDYNMSMVGLVKSTSGSSNLAQTIPEPSSLALLGAGIVGLAGWVWRRRRAAK